MEQHSEPSCNTHHSRWTSYSNSTPAQQPDRNRAIAHSERTRTTDRHTTTILILTQATSLIPVLVHHCLHCHQRLRSIPPSASDAVVGCGQPSTAERSSLAPVAALIPSLDSQRNVQLRSTPNDALQALVQRRRGARRSARLWGKDEARKQQQRRVPHSAPEDKGDCRQTAVTAATQKQTRDRKRTASSNCSNSSARDRMQQMTPT